MKAKLKNLKENPIKHTRSRLVAACTPPVRVVGLEQHAPDAPTVASSL